MAGRPRLPRGGWIAATVAAVAMPLGCGGGEDPVLPESVPPVIEAQPRDPGGDADARLTMPPRGRWFGFNSALFIHTGRGGDLDLGITPEGTVRDAVAAGANSGRIEVLWNAVEPTEGTYDEAMLAVYDRYVSALERSGGKVLLLLGGTPQWAAVDPGHPGSPPRADEAGRKAFARFAGFVARRWPRAAAIETWNEPNGRFAWAPRPDPAAYAALHRAAAAAIRDAAPDTDVVLGGVSTPVKENPDFMRAQVFLKRMFAAGLKPSDYDGIAVHNYVNLGPIDGGEFAQGLEDARLGHAWIDPDPPLWITETGVTTTGPYASSPEDQARRLTAAVRKLLTAPRVKGVFVHTLYDLTFIPQPSPDRGYGIMEPRGARPGAPKPAHRALAAMAGR